MKPKHTMSSMKAMKMLKEGMVKGKTITKKQRGYFGAVASGTSRKMARRKY